MSIDITITPEHLTEARQKVTPGHVDVFNCLMATAIKASGLMTNFQSCSSTQVYRNDGTDLDIVSEGRRHEGLVRMFDNGDDDRIRRRLPLTVTLVDPFSEGQ